MIGRNPRDTDDAKIRPKLNEMIFVDRKNLHIDSLYVVPQGFVYDKMFHT